TGADDATSARDSLVLCSPGDTLDVASAMQDSDDANALFRLTVVNHVRAERKTSQTRREFLAPAARARLPREHFEPAGNCVDESARGGGTVTGDILADLK